jgi:hypothetical protein
MDYLNRFREKKGKPIDLSKYTKTIIIILKLKGMLAGYKTYIAGTLSVLTAIGAYLSGDISLIDAINVIIPAVMGMTVRSAIAKK